MSPEEREAEFAKALYVVRQMQPQLFEAVEKGIEQYGTQDISLFVWQKLDGKIQLVAGPREKVVLVVATVMGDGAVIDQFGQPCEGGYWLAIKLIDGEGVSTRMRRAPMPQA